ncbi:MAG: HAD family hydrolase [Acidobacteria bacterium]|jgi:D-glycero-D-manno-heptose 1,7-bisphosphate phosphatase|nr:MAG: HAD family hydrolase [Acidobacteriota bacterium]GIU82826.1 MAG: D,D-heptose 1,7-bisphosphate phosphatase [Pyrinomonadaceae bacterium]
MTGEVKRAIFLDRDGTLIEEVNFLHRVEDLRFFPFTEEAVSILKNAGFLLIVVTNQSGVGRGMFSADIVVQIHEAIQRRLDEKIDRFYFCTHLPEEGCECRKPNVGMIEQAKEDFSIDLENSWIIGDKRLDMELGFNAGINTCLVLTGYGNVEVHKLKRKPDLIAENLLEAARKIIWWNS